MVFHVHLKKGAIHNDVFSDNKLIHLQPQFHTKVHMPVLSR